MEQLTRLLHLAYADHAAAGQVFFASHQSAQDTAYRLGKGECWVAFQGNAMVATVTVAAPFAAPEGYRLRRALCTSGTRVRASASAGS